jgi:hypothetical protein
VFERQLLSGVYHPIPLSGVSPWCPRVLQSLCFYAAAT